MRVKAPNPPSFGVRRNDITGIRLARHVAVLFGVDVPENPTETVWVSDFNKVTVGDIGRGAPKTSKTKVGSVGHLPEKGWYLADRSLVEGPLGKPDEPGATPVARVEGIEEVPSATLNRFKPDTKAAALVAGAEHLFSGLEETFRDAIRVLGTLEDGTQLGNSVRIGVWASLVAEVYRSQPALFTAAIQARLTQKASLSTWSPLIPPEQAEQSASCEFGHQGNDDAWEPVNIGILDKVVKEYVRPTFTNTSESDSNSSESGDPNQEYLTDGLIDRWCRHLTQSADRGLAWTVDEQRRRRVEIYLSGVNPLSRFLSEIQLLSPRILPYGAENLEDNWTPFDPQFEDHRRRVRPRIPSRAELGPLPEKSQMAIVHTLLCIHRTLRVNASFTHAKMFEEVSGDQLALSELSKSLWGPDAPLSVWTRHMWLRGMISEVRDRDKQFVDQNWPEFMETIRRLHQLRELRLLSTGDWVDILSGASVDLNARIRDLNARSAVPEATALRSELLQYWKEILEALSLNVELSAEGTSPVGANPDPNLLRAAYLLHNYLGVALRSESFDERLNAVRFGYRVVLPLRRRVAQDRKNDAAARLTAQITSRAAARLASETTDETLRKEMLDLGSGLLKELLKTKMVTELLTGAKLPEKTSHLNVLNAISETALTLLESESRDSPLAFDQVGKVVGLARTAFTVLAGHQQVDPKDESDRARDVRRYEERWKRLVQARKP